MSVNLDVPEPKIGANRRRDKAGIMAGYTTFGDENFGASQMATGGGFNSGFMSQSPSKQSQQMGDTVAESIRPITILQLKNAESTPDGTFRISGADVSQISLVGMINQISVQASTINYTLDDGTGMIQLVKWVQTDMPEDQKEAESIRFPQNSYIRAHGVPRTNDSGTYMLTYGIRAIEDHNEVTYHLLECMSVHKELTEPKTAPASLSTFTSPMGVNVSGAGMAMGTNHANDMGGGYGSLNSLQDQVLKSIQRHSDTDAGASTTDIMQECGGMPEPAIRDAIQFLVNEGHVYETVDECHFKPTG